MATAARSGFHRVLLGALAHGALYYAVCGRRADAVAALRALETDWLSTRTLASAEWVSAAASAGVLLGAEEAARVRGMLKHSPRHTPWVVAAMATLEGRITSDPTCHLEAAEGYARIGDASDRILALAAAARTFVEIGELDRAEPVIAEVAEFADRNAAPRLLDGLTPRPAPQPQSRPPLPAAP
jgi:hypothetical protein